jgi:hypothetical protein
VGLLIALLLAPQADPGIDEALTKAVAYLKAAAPERPELLLWTLLRLQTPDRTPEVRRLMDDMLQRPLDSTPHVALQAMILESIDRARFQVRLAQCAQFLVDTQARDGFWGAGRAVVLPKVLIPRPKGGPAKVKISQRAEGPATGDPTNARWAAWGLLACHEAGMLLPADVVEKAARAWLAQDLPAADVVTSLFIYDTLRDRPWKQDPHVLKAIDRLAAAPAPAEPASLYGLSRALRGIDRERVGGRDWYQDGARTLKASQAPDGSWGALEATCYAALFLRR